MTLQNVIEILERHADIAYEEKHFPSYDELKAVITTIEQHATKLVKFQDLGNQLEKVQDKLEDLGISIETMRDNLPTMED